MNNEGKEVELTAAVVVTFNRKVLLKNCINALLNQTVPLDAVIVIDNASTDGTEDFLREAGLLNDSRLIYQKLESNTGGAGGFNHGITLSLKMGFNWIWLMDDDAEASRDAFEQLHRDPDVKKIGLAASRILNPDGTLQQRVLDSVIANDRLFRGIAHYDHNIVGLLQSYPLLGLLVRSSLIKSAGNVNPEYFIQADDLDWTLRLSKNRGIKYVFSSTLKHYDDVRVEAKNSFGKQRFYLSRKDLWKDYYGFRNLILTLKSMNISGWRFHVTKEYINRVVKRILINEDAWFACQIYSLAFWHGVCGISGKRVMPGATQFKLGK